MTDLRPTSLGGVKYRSRQGHAAVVVIGFVLVVLGFGTCAYAIIVKGGMAMADGEMPEPASVFGTFGVGFALFAVGALTATIGGALSKRSSATGIHDDGYETVTRPRKGEPIARHGNSSHELFDD